MKKILAFLLAVIVVLSFSGCMGATSSTPKVQEVTSPATTDEIAFANYKNTLEGLCEYLADLGFAYDIKPATGDEAADPVVMKADIIGASKGYKFTYKYEGKTTVLELYEYTDRNTGFYNQAQAGKITISEDIENGVVDVLLSSNGKYLMIYNDEAKNIDREKMLTKAFTEFYGEE